MRMILPCGGKVGPGVERNADLQPAYLKNPGFEKLVGIPLFD